MKYAIAFLLIISSHVFAATTQDQDVADAIKSQQVEFKVYNLMRASGFAQIKQHLYDSNGVELHTADMTNVKWFVEKFTDGTNHINIIYQVTDSNIPTSYGTALVSTIFINGKEVKII